jgi:hypothetical protein
MYFGLLCNIEPYRGELQEWGVLKSINTTGTSINRLSQGTKKPPAPASGSCDFIVE